MKKYYKLAFTGLPEGCKVLIAPQTRIEFDGTSEEHAEMVASFAAKTPGFTLIGE